MGTPVVHPPTPGGSRVWWSFWGTYNGLPRNGPNKVAVPHARVKSAAARSRSLTLRSLRA